MKSPGGAIGAAERILPGRAGPTHAVDPRWQAITAVAEFVETHPEELWTFTRRWGASRDPDLRRAVASCLLEHLLEFHFALLFPRVEQAAREDPLFAATFLSCWEFGQTELPAHLARFRALKSELRST